MKFAFCDKTDKNSLITVKILESVETIFLTNAFTSFNSSESSRLLALVLSYLFVLFELKLLLSKDDGSSLI